ncbi:MAG: transglutaminase family protein [Anaerolineae bacterium]
MALKVFVWAWRRFRPREGWLPLFLLLGIVLCLVTAVTKEEWVPEAGIVAPMALLGLFMGLVLAKRPLSGRLAWAFIIIYGLLLTTISLGALRPPLRTLFDGWGPVSQFLRRSGALFLARMSGWFVAAFSGGSSRETIVFAFGLSFLAWALSAYIAWSSFRQQRPLLGLSVMGVALAANEYYGAAGVEWIVLYVGLAALLTAVQQYASLEQQWQARAVDFSDEVRFDLIIHAGGVALFLLIVALLLPTFSITKLSQAFMRQPAVSQAEQTLERVFAGVQMPQRTSSVTSPGGPGGRGLLPRAYLLGDPPELYETVVMTAVVTLPGAGGRQAASVLAGAHWRALSYDVYTGRGWALSEEREEAVAAGAPIPLPSAQSQVRVSQSVHWLPDERLIRYSLGLPLQFDQAVTTLWREPADLARVQGDGMQYQLASRVSRASAAELRQAAMMEIPPALLAHYTALPSSVPERVRALAAGIAGEAPTAYDKARALERFLRQYPYSLEVGLPPDGADPVDFFLFDLQRGYCDYYASAMVVMARSLGLPARLGVGFLAQPPDERGVQTIRQINGHSWAEIYFAGYGWIEFEPTAPFPSRNDTSLSALDPANPDVALEPAYTDTPPIPEPDHSPRSSWTWAGLALIVFLGGWLWRRQARPSGADSVFWAYGRLLHHAQKLGHLLPPSQTPHEFAADFLAQMSRFEERPQLSMLVQELRPRVERLTRLFIARQYGRERRVGSSAALEEWAHLRRPLWLLRIVSKFIKP